MKKTIALLLVLLFCHVEGQDTTYATSRTDARLFSYRDSITAYTVGCSVTNELRTIFREMTGTKDYDAYFENGWKKSISVGDPVDTALGYSVFLENTVWPYEVKEGDQFQSSSSYGQRIAYQFNRLDTLRVLPPYRVEGAEMPVLFIYAKPSRVVLYRKLDRCWEKKMRYSTLDVQTHFIINDKDKTIIPYNIRRFYVENKLTKTEWVDPVNTNQIIRTFSH